MTAEEFETKLIELVHEAVVGGVALDDIQDALDRRNLAINERLAE